MFIYFGSTKVLCSPCVMIVWNHKFLASGMQHALSSPFNLVKGISSTLLTSFFNKLSKNHRWFTFVQVFSSSRRCQDKHGDSDKQGWESQTNGSHWNVNGFLEYLISMLSRSVFYIKVLFLMVTPILLKLCKPLVILFVASSCLTQWVPRIMDLMIVILSSPLCARETSDFVRRFFSLLPSVIVNQLRANEHFIGLGSWRMNGSWMEQMSGRIRLDMLEHLVE